MLAHDMARSEGGTFLLRIEDIDSTRSRTLWEQQIYDDLTWLGITWDGPVMRQSERIGDYLLALHDLWDRHVLFPCHCSRRDIMAAASAPQEGVEPTYGPDGLIYPGICREKSARAASFPKHQALRLDIRDCLDAIGDKTFSYNETGLPSAGTMEFTAQELNRNVGDIVLSRRDFPGSYHLSVVLDDAAQGITHVIRGQDLEPATKIHVMLQRLLNLPTPTYHHHKLIRDENGKRLAKRDDARAISTYRAEGATPADIRAMVGL